MAKKIDLTGQRFGRLTVLGLHGMSNQKKRRSLWECKCECGNVVILNCDGLIGEKTKSCGCLFKEMLKRRNTRHGMRGTRLNRIWRGMKSRCHTPSSSSYKYYGARGIKVCEEWREFEPFMEWALANGYEERLEVDRIDNYGDYCPENCRIVTREENLKNTRKAQDLREHRMATG